MNQLHEILNLAKQNKGVLTTAMVVKAGFSRGSLKYLVDNGRLERAERGVYTLPDAWEDEFVNIQTRYKRGIFSLDTALFLCGGSKEPFYSLGIENLITPGGHTVKAYGAERTLCDILKSRNHTDIQVVTDAFKRYAARKEKNIPLLSEYARSLKTESRLRAYLEVLL